MRNITRLFNVARRGLFQGTLSFDRTLDALEALVNAVNDCDDVKWNLGEGTECTLDSLLIGTYWFCGDYHSGQWSTEYRLLCAIGNFYGPSSLKEDSSEFDVYQQLHLSGLRQLGIHDAQI